MNATEEMSFDRSALLEETTRIVLDASAVELAGGLSAESANYVSRGSHLTGHALSAEFINNFADKCATETLQLLANAGSLEQGVTDQLRSGYKRLLQNRPEEAPAPDLLVFLLQPNADSVTIEENQFDDLDRWSEAAIDAFNDQQRIAKLPFLHQTRPPSIYKEIPEVYQFCQALMTPIVQAHQNDLVTIASINPVSAVRVADVLAEMIEDAIGRPPIWFGVVSDANSWRNLNRKHFGL